MRLFALKDMADRADGRRACSFTDFQSGDVISSTGRTLRQERKKERKSVRDGEGVCVCGDNWMEVRREGF